MQAQNARTRAVLDADPGRAAAGRPVHRAVRRRHAGAPAIRGGRLFSIDRWGGLEQAVLVVRDVHGDRPAAQPRSSTPTAVTGDPNRRPRLVRPDRDGRLVAFGTSTGGDERSTLGVIDVATGELLPDPIPTPGRRRWRGCRTAGPSPTPATPTPRRWATRRPTTTGPSGGTCWATTRATTSWCSATCPTGPAWPSVELSRDGRWLLVELSLGWTRIDVHLIDRTTGARTTVIEGVDAVSSFTVVDDRLVGTTTLDAPGAGS